MHNTYRASLEKNREKLNNEFKLFQQTYRRAEDGIFFDRFKALLECLPATPPANAETLILNAFSALLELARQDPTLQLERSAKAFDAWTMVLPKSSELFAKQPSKLLATLANAVLVLEKHEGVRVEDFIGKLSAISSLCDDISTFQSAGTVSAWVSGFSRNRAAALSALQSLPAQIFKALFPQSPFSGSQLAERWKVNPWLDYSSPHSQSSTSKIARATGGFVGFGGQFQRVPFLEAHEEGFLVSDDVRHWHLSADVFGATWTSTNLAAKKSKPEKIKIKGFENPISTASNQHTIAFTIPTSLRVYLMARSHD